MRVKSTKMKTKIAKAIVRTVLALSWVVNPVMAQQAGADKSPAKFKGPLKVFILAGQSNMEGHAGVQTLDQLGKHPTHGYLLKKIKKDDGSFMVRDDVFDSYKKENEHIKRPLSVGTQQPAQRTVGHPARGLEKRDLLGDPQ